MEVIFLGTGSAWGLPEHACECRICQNMRRLGEERLRTALFLRGKEGLLVDCGPDIRRQLMRSRIRRIDAILITHGHGDHCIGLDELEVLRRKECRESWTPIPVFASEKTWEALERRFDYLVGKLLEKGLARVGEPLDKLRTKVVPFSTIHSDSARGSVGYVVEENTEAGSKKLVYTSDFVDIDGCSHLLKEADVLITQAHFFQEPVDNRPGHMSFQRILDFIQEWRPKSAVFLVHISDSDTIPGDGANHALKKFEPVDPMRDPKTGLPYPIPTCHREWQERVDQVRADRGIGCRITVAFDGLRIRPW